MNPRSIRAAATWNSRPDGAIVVRVPSRAAADRPLPDAVFAFRAGDPQFAFWQQQFSQVQHASR